MSGACVFRRILGEPLDDARHIWLKGPGRREVKDTSTNASSILEVMRDSAGHENERPLRAVEPLLAHADAHYAFDDIEEIIFGVRVRSGPLCSWLKPPFRYRIPRLGFLFVCFEHRGDSAHRICTPPPRSQDDGLSWRHARLAHSLFPSRDLTTDDRRTHPREAIQIRERSSAAGRSPAPRRPPAGHTAPPGATRPSPRDGG